MVIAMLPVASVAQVPSVDQVVGGVTDTVGGVVPPPPALPTESAPREPPAVPAPGRERSGRSGARGTGAGGPDAAVNAPAPAPSAQTPVGSAPQRQQSSAPAAAGGSAGALPSDPGGGNASGGTSFTRALAHEPGRQDEAPRAARKLARQGRRDPSAHGAGSTGGDQLAMARGGRAAPGMSRGPRGRRSPVSRSACCLWAGLSALGLGFAIHRGAVRPHFRRAISEKNPTGGFDVPLALARSSHRGDHWRRHPSCRAGHGPGAGAGCGSGGRRCEPGGSGRGPGGARAARAAAGTGTGAGGTRGARAGAGRLGSVPPAPGPGSHAERHRERVPVLRLARRAPTPPAGRARRPVGTAAACARTRRPTRTPRAPARAPRRRTPRSPTTRRARPATPARTRFRSRASSSR